MVVLSPAGAPAPSSDNQRCRAWARGCLGVRLCPVPAPGSPPGGHAEGQA